MSQLLQKIKALYGKIHVTHISYEKHGMNPRHDWNIILFASCLALLLETIFAFYFYTRINQGKLFVVTKNDSGKEITINSKLLGKIIDDINLRQKSLENIKQNKAVPGDPSL